MSEKQEKPQEEDDFKDQQKPTGLQQAQENQQTPAPQVPTPQDPQSGQPGQDPNGQKQLETKVRTAQNFILAGSIVGLVGWITEGLLFGVVGLVLSIVGLRKELAIEKENPGIAKQLKRLRSSAYFAIVICATAIFFAIIMTALWYPYIVEYMETGDIESLYSDMGSVEEPETNSTWG